MPSRAQRMPGALSGPCKCCFAGPILSPGPWGLAGTGKELGLIHVCWNVIGGLWAKEGRDLTQVLQGPSSCEKMGRRGTRKEGGCCHGPGWRRWRRGRSASPSASRHLPGPCPWRREEESPHHCRIAIFSRSLGSSLRVIYLPGFFLERA